MSFFITCETRRSNNKFGVPAPSIPQFWVRVLSWVMVKIPDLMAKSARYQSYYSRLVQQQQQQ